MDNDNQFEEALQTIYFEPIFTYVELWRVKIGFFDIHYCLSMFIQGKQEYQSSLKRSRPQLKAHVQRSIAPQICLNEFPCIYLNFLPEEALLYESRGSDDHQYPPEHQDYDQTDRSQSPRGCYGMKRPLLLDALDQEANKGKESYQYDQIYPHETDDFTPFAIEVLFEVGAVELLVHLAIVVVFFQTDLAVDSHFSLREFMRYPRLQTLLVAQLSSTSAQAVLAQLASLLPLQAYPAVPLLRLPNFLDQHHLLRSKIRGCEAL